LASSRQSDSDTSTRGASRRPGSASTPGPARPSLTPSTWSNRAIALRTSRVGQRLLALFLEGELLVRQVILLRGAQALPLTRTSFRAPGTCASLAFGDVAPSRFLLRSVAMKFPPALVWPTADAYRPGQPHAVTRGRACSGHDDLGQVRARPACRPGWRAPAGWGAAFVEAVEGQAGGGEGVQQVGSGKWVAPTLSRTPLSVQTP